MADLTVLIRLHKHQLDEKRRAVAVVLAEMAALERVREALEQEFIREKEAADAQERERTGTVPYTFASYAQGVAERRAALLEQEVELQQRLDLAKEAMMETFSEMKKFEMAEEERRRLEEEELRLREGKIMDEIGLQGFRRREDDDTTR